MFSFSLLLLALLASLGAVVNGLSCPVKEVNRNRRDAIKDSYCRSEDVYVGRVMAAKCNCLESDSSHQSYCHYYQLDVPNTIINTTRTSSGTCEIPDGFNELQACSSIGNSLVSWGFRVEGPKQSSPVIVRNLTADNLCSLPCSFNTGNEKASQLQPCLYTIRIGEIFKGNYSTNEDIEVPGPDIISVNSKRILQVYTDYVAGIGGPCSSIMSWSQQSTYSSEELDQLREDMDCGGFVFLPSYSLLLSLSFIVLLVLSKG